MIVVLRSKSIDGESFDENASSSIIDQSVELPTGGADIDQSLNENCHDSGIDMRDPNAIIPPVARKNTYSDADIVLSSDWVPPITIAPTDIIGSPAVLATSLGAPDVVSSRKKASSVSFSVDDNSEQHSSTSSERSNDNKKNKMLKRLSYPLTWVEGLTGEAKPATDSTESAPNTGDSNQSVFSKVFSRYARFVFAFVCDRVHSFFLLRRGNSLRCFVKKKIFN